MTTTSDPRVDFSIVIPVYYNEGLLGATMTTIKEQVLARNPGRTAEVIFVDDGSGDGSLRELLEIRQQDPGLVKVIKLTRNFGQVPALHAGFCHARGQCVIGLSADGQDPASLMNDMLKAHFDEGYEVVVAARAGRDESIYRVVTSRVFYALMRRLCFPHMPAGGFDYVLLGRKALETLLRNHEAQPFIQGQVLWMGYRTKRLEYQRLKRLAGSSRWTFGKKITYLIDGVMNYSFLPIRFMSLLGIAVSLLGFAYALFIIVLKLVGGIPAQGWAPIMIVILVLGGLQMLMLGVIGEYIWRTLMQARRRDLYVIEEVYE